MKTDLAPGFGMESNKGRGSLNGYFVALLAPAVIAVVMQVTWPFFQQNPVQPYLLAVIFCAWYGGLGPGLLSTVISFLLADFFFIEPYIFFWFHKQDDLVRLLIFAAVGSFISLMSELMQRERRRAEINFESAKRAEKSLREKERFVNQIAELSPVVINVLDLATRRDVYISPDVVNLLGYTPKEIAEMENPMSVLWHPEDIPRGRENLSRLTHATDGEIAESEYRIRRRDGEWRWVASRSMPFDRDEHGVVRQIVTASLDITERKQAEEALRASETKFRRLLDSSIIGVVFWSLEGEILEANDLFLAMIGYTREDLSQGRLSWKNLTPPEYADADEKAIREMAATGACSPLEKEYIRKDGNRVSVLIGSALFEGRKDTGSSFIMDITERKRVEWAQKESQLQYETLVQSIDGIVWEADPRTFTFSFVSKQAERILGYPLEQWFEGPEFWPDHMHPDDRGWAVAFCVDATARGVDHQFEYRMIAADGRVVWLSDIVTLHLVDDQSVVLRGLMVDITDRKLTEEKLRQSEAQLAEAQRLASVGSWNWDIRTNTHTWSDELYRVFGLQPQESAPSFETYVELVHADERDDICRAVQHALKTQGQINTYRRIIRPDGAERILHSRWNTISDISGTPIRMHGTLQDVTERKRAEGALQQAQSRIESILNSVADIHILFDRDWHYLYVNEAAVRSIGLPREHILGRTLWELYPDIVGTELERQFHRAMKERIFVAFDFHYLTLDTWWENRFYPAPEGLSVFGTNITERKRTEESLRESEERFRQVAENLQDVIWMVDSEVKRLLYVSPAYEKIWGRSCASLYQDMRAFMEPVHPDDREIVVRMLEEQKACKLISAEYRIIQPDGSVRWIRDRSFPVRNTEGEVYRVAGVAEDITESKLAEEKLRATTKQLRALSASLQSAREEEGTRIAREIHDELGAALSSLRWDLEGVDEGMSESGNGSQPQELRKKIEAMMRLTDTTINVVRRIASELRPTALDDLGLTEAIEWQARQFQDRTEIIVQCDCNLENVDLSREQSTAVFRIFQEALTNILRHAQATQVNIQMNDEDGEFVLTVTDNGRGITVDEKSGQRTLGLLGMRERGHLIGAKIDVTGSDGKGTVVTVRIPLRLKEYSEASH